MSKKSKIRVIDTGFLNASENMALDETILKLREENVIPDTIRFLSFKPHCVLVGYFQSIENEVRINFCRQKGIEINRRITGGGTLYWGASDIGWEIFASMQRFLSQISAIEDYYRLFCSAVSMGINKFGLKSGFRPRNDIEIEGKKISGSGGTSIKNAFMFQGTLLVDTNLDIMLRALRVPVEKLKYNEISSLKDRITWLTRELGYCPPRQEIIKNLLDGFSETLDIDYYFDELSIHEKRLFKKKIDYFRSKKHIYRIKQNKSIFCIKSMAKTETGVIKCNTVVDIKRKILKSLIFTGDFFIYPKRAIFDLEAVLKNTSARKENIKKIIEDFFASYPQKIEGITAEIIILTVDKCIEKLEFEKYKIPYKYYNDIFIIETDGNKTAKLDIKNKIEVFLMPYCAKLIGCSFRYTEGCNLCGKCSTGEIAKITQEAGIRSITITSYEHLEETLIKLKKEGINFFAGCCCEAFYIKHKEDFENIGLPGILINIDNSTCYDLGKEKDAYLGKFEGFTELKIPLVKKIIKIFNFSEKRKKRRKYMLECDVLIIGGGPAGSSLSYYLANNGIKVILAEKKKNIDTPLRCAEFVPANIAGLFDFKIYGINNQIDFMDTYVSPATENKDFEMTSQTDSPGFILDRDCFVKDIIERFEKLGGKFIKSSKALVVQNKETYSSSPTFFNSVQSKDNTRLSFYINNYINNSFSAIPEDYIITTFLNNNSKDIFNIKSKIVAGADGPFSFIGRLIGSINKSFIFAMQENLKIKDSKPNHLKIFFSPFIKCGYGWIFPKTHSINLGIGIDCPKNLKRIFKLFKNHLQNSEILNIDNMRDDFYKNNSNKKITGLIPISGIVKKPVYGNFILIGDAAGLCNPITGAGIFNAIYSAKLASEIIIKSLKKNDLKILDEIKEIYIKEFEQSINRAIKKRAYMKQNWQNKMLPFSDLLRTTWIAYKDYWE